MRKAFVLLLLLPMLAGCDPSEEELAKGKNIDIGRMRGKVVTKEVSYFKGDTKGTEELKGMPYYSLLVSFMNKKDQLEQKWFYGVPVEVFDGINEGDSLPTHPFVTANGLTKVSGKVVDRFAGIANSRWYIVVDDQEKVKIFMVAAEVYYRRIDIGMVLPLKEAE